MIAFLRIGVSLAVFSSLSFAQQQVSVPQDVIVVTGTAGVDAQAEIVGHNVDNGGDIPFGTFIGNDRFDAKVTGQTNTARGKAETYGPATAVNGVGFTRKRGVLNYYMDLGGLGLWDRTTSAIGGATYKFKPKPGFGVEGYFRAKSSGRLHRFGAATATTSVCVTADGGLSLELNQDDRWGTYSKTGSIVTLPAEGTIQQSLEGQVNGAGRVRGKVQTTLYFVPTKIWVEMPNPMGGPPIQGQVIFE